jgi:hypothetical protein
MQKTVCRFYTPEDITEAKKILWNAYGEDSIIGRFCARQRSSTREAHDAEAADIIAAFHRLDQAKMLTTRFVHGI